MSILILNGSPRINGNTHILLNRVIDGIHAEGKDAELVHLAKLELAPCTGCGVCESKGLCAIDDAMTDLYDKTQTVRHLIIASPIYFYGITAQAKAFVDRCQVFWSRKYLLGQSREGQTPRYGYFVSVAATGGAKCFDCARLTLRYAFDAMDLVYNGGVVVQGVDERGADAKKPDSLQAAFELGQKIGATR